MAARQRASAAVRMPTRRVGRRWLCCLAFAAAGRACSLGSRIAIENQNVDAFHDATEVNEGGVLVRRNHDVVLYDGVPRLEENEVFSSSAVCGKGLEQMCSAGDRECEALLAGVWRVLFDDLAHEHRCALRFAPEPSGMRVHEALSCGSELSEFQFRAVDDLRAWRFYLGTDFYFLFSRRMVWSYLDVEMATEFGFLHIGRFYKCAFASESVHFDKECLPVRPFHKILKRERYLDSDG